MRGLGTYLGGAVLFSSTWLTASLNRRTGGMLNTFMASAIADFSSGSSTVPRCLFFAAR